MAERASRRERRRVAATDNARRTSDETKQGQSERRAAGGESDRDGARESHSRAVRSEAARCAGCTRAECTRAGKYIPPTQPLAQPTQYCGGLQCCRVTVSQSRSLREWYAGTPRSPLRSPLPIVVGCSKVGTAGFFQKTVFFVWPGIKVFRFFIHAVRRLSTVVCFLSLVLAIGRNTWKARMVNRRLANSLICHPIPSLSMIVPFSL